MSLYTRYLFYLVTLPWGKPQDKSEFFPHCPDPFHLGKNKIARLTGNGKSYTLDNGKLHGFGARSVNE